jgi:hypothetical protein
MIGMVVVAFLTANAAGVVTTMMTSNHLRRKLLESLRAALCISALYNDVSASGHATAALPRSEMKVRRGIIRSPRRRARAALAGFRGQAPWRF